MTTIQQYVARHWPEGGLARGSPLVRRHAVIGLLVFVAAIAMRIPFRATYLVNWDAVNFALGVESFNLEHHQPHPPGYIGYVLLGRLVNWVVGDPVTALTAISVISGAAATMWVFVLGLKFGSERAALIAAILFGTSPLVWYYSEVALTYIVEVALALPLVWLVMQARARSSIRLLLLATLLIAMMGALRQTSLVLFLPLWIYGWLSFPRRDRWLPAGVLVGSVMSWLIPLLILAGGPIAYLRLSRDLAQLTGGLTWFGAGFGVIQNFVVVVSGLALGLHASLLAIPLASIRRFRPPRLDPEHRRVMLIWAAPPLVVYLLIHSGQLGYVLVLLPLGIIWAARVFDRWLADSRRVVVAAGVMMAINLIGFTVLPEVAYAAVSRGELTIPSRMATPWLFKGSIRQASLPRSDAHWEALVAWVGQFDEETTAVLAEPRDGGSFRHLSFYLPDHLVYGIGSDQHGRLGHLFTAIGHQIDYSVQRLEQASPRLHLPARIQTLVIPDPHLQELFEGDLELQRIVLRDGTIGAVADLREQSSILFLGPTGTPLIAPRNLANAIWEGEDPSRQSGSALATRCGWPASSVGLLPDQPGGSDHGVETPSAGAC
ncbi:MAG: ArnT family glycosyltransferase [Acidimicrobiia bacterium]